MTIQDIVIGALTAWRENRGGGSDGMQSVINVLINRATQHETSVYHEATKKWQFSSMTAPNDSELILYPTDTDADFELAIGLMQKANDGNLTDLTGGATFYYAENMTVAPSWASTMVYTTTIEKQLFYKVA